MLENFAHRHLDLGMAIQDARTSFMIIEKEFKESGRRDEDPSDFVWELSETIKKMAALCKELGLSTSGDLLALYITDLPQTEREFDVLVQAIRSELKHKEFMFVPPERAQYYDLILPPPLDAFPMSSRELCEAGKCYACGLYTASVFHAMRAAEIGVRVLAVALNVSFPDKPLDLADWGPILDQADTKIKAIAQQPKSHERDQDQKFYAQAAAQFRHFKDGWRARAAHARDSFLEHQAQRILDHTLEFFLVLSSRLKE